MLATGSKFVIGLSLGLSLHAADPLVGMWKQDRSKTKFDQRPPVITLEPFENGGVKYSTETGPVYAATLDEKEYAALGPMSATDKVKVKKVGANSYEVTTTRNGRRSTVERVEVQNNGKRLVRSVTLYPEKGQPTTNVFYYTRQSAGAEGLPYFGTWVNSPQETKFGAGPPTVTISEADGGGLTYTFGTGTTYTVKFDGPEATVPDSGGMTVTGQRVDDHTVALTYQRKGEVMSVVRMSAEPNGRSLTITPEVHLANGQTRTTTLVYTRQ
jgi:hypothetical protein